MGRRYKIPRCVSELPSGNLCGHEMRPLGERDPRAAKFLADANMPGVWVFHCGYCSAVQALSADQLDRYAEKA